jgi:hypothetical protein
MTDLYDKINANKQVKDLKQPNLTRQRHRFKGPRESQKVNLEIDQIRYDLLNYKRQIEEFEEALHAFYEEVLNGTSYYLPIAVSDFFRARLHRDLSDYALPPTEE